jgi:hypothetical protein
MKLSGSINIMGLFRVRLIRKNRRSSIGMRSLYTKKGWKGIFLLFELTPAGLFALFVWIKSR